MNKNDSQKLVRFKKLVETNWNKKIFGLLHTLRNEKTLDIDDKTMKKLSKVIGDELSNYFIKLNYVGLK